MRFKSLFNLFLIMVLLISSTAITTAKRDDKVQESLDTKILSSYGGDSLFVFAQNIKLGYRDQREKFKEIIREGNYIFENEKILADIFVRNPSEVNNINQVVVTIGVTQEIGNDIEGQCIENRKEKSNLNKDIRFNPLTDRWYKCEFTAETPDSMYGEYFITVEAITMDNSAIAENMNLYYFVNPVIAVSVDGDVIFENVEGGKSYLSGTILIGNDVDEGSGVPLDLYISGTNFYDPDSSTAKCPSTNQLSLNQITYKANYGGIETSFESIPYNDNFNLEIVKPIIKGIKVTPGGEVSVVFKLDVPEICVGNFNTGDIFFWGKPSDNSPYVPNSGVGIGIDITTI